jgi:hypothetical protein
MSMTEITMDRREGKTRVGLEADVRMLPPGPLRTIWGSTKNICESGMFVFSAETYSVNSELLCDLCLPHPHPNLPVRGRVAWIQEQPSPGMGIEFVDLTEPDRSILGEILEEQVVQHEDVKVWFESLTYPIRAKAARSGQSLLLRSALRFLRLSSPVVVYDAAAEKQTESYSGVLQSVTLRHDYSTSIPELLVRLDLTDAPPQPSLEGARLELDPAPTDAPLAPEEPASQGEIVAQVPAPPERPTWEPSVLSQLPLEPLNTRVAAPIASSSDEWVIDLPAEDPRETSDWRLEGPTEEEQGLQARRRGARPWLVALLLVALGFGTTYLTAVYTNLWARASALVASWDDEGPAPTSPVSPPPAATPAPAAEDNAEKPAPPPLPKQTPAPPPPKKQASRAPAKGTLAPRVITHDGHKMLVVPLKGSTDGAVHYLLANPKGIAVNLPKAKPRAPFGDFRLGKEDHPFSLIWLHTRGDGVHVRVHFAEGLPEHRLRILEQELRVELRPPAK